MWLIACATMHEIHFSHHIPFFTITKSIKMPLKHEGEKLTTHCCIPVFMQNAHISLHTHYQFINQRKFNKPDLLFLQWPNIIFDWGHSLTMLIRFWPFLTTCLHLWRNYFTVKYNGKSAYRWHFWYHLPTSSCHRSLWTPPYPDSSFFLA